MGWHISPLRTVFGWFESALHVLEDRFTIRKNTSLIRIKVDEDVDIFWRVVTVILWILCSHIRRYDIVLRGCSPIVVETMVPLLRVMLVTDEAMRREEMMCLTWPNCIARLNCTPAVARNNLIQQKRKERVGPRTAFVVEQFVWFIIIISSLDLRNIHRLSVALFVVNTIHWARFGLSSAACFLGLYLLVTHFWLPSYSLRDTFLALSGQRSWVYTIYSSYSLAFSLTLLITDTQFLQRARREIIWRVLKVGSALEKNLINTPLRCIFDLQRLLLNYFFFVGFNFFMALCMWFSTMMFEWAFDTSCTGVICTIGVVYIILGKGRAEGFRKALREGIVCFLAYLSVVAFIFYFVSAQSLSFMANCVSSGFFVLYIAAYSPRRVYSAAPLAVIWLIMVAVDACWQAHHTSLGTQHIMWYKKLLYVNTIAFGWLFLLGTVLDMYEWSFPKLESTTPAVAVSGFAAKTIKSEQKQKEKAVHASVQLNGEKSNGSTHNNNNNSVTATVAAAVTTVNAVLRKLSSTEESVASPVLPSLPPSMVMKDIKTVNTVDTGIDTVETEERDNVLEESSCISPPSRTEKHMLSSSDVDTALVMAKHKSLDVSEVQSKATVLLSQEEESEEAVQEEAKNEKEVEEEVEVQEEKEEVAVKKADKVVEVGEHSSHLTSSEKSSSTLFVLKGDSVVTLQSSPSSSTSSTTTMSTREKQEVNSQPNEITAPFSVVNDASHTAPSSLSIPLSASPQQTSSNASSTERRRKSGEWRNKKALQSTSVANESSRKEGKSKPTIATQIPASITVTVSAAPKTQPSVKSIAGNTTKTMNIPLPRGMRAKEAAATSSESGDSTVVVASTATATKKPSVPKSTVAPIKILAPMPQTEQRAVNDVVVKKHNENTVRTNTSKLLVSPTPPVSSQPVKQQNSGKKTIYTEFIEPKRRPAEKNTVRVGVKSIAKPSTVTLPSSHNSTEVRRSTGESSTTVTGIAAGGASPSNFEFSQSVEKARHTGSDVRETPTLTIPQPRSTRNAASTAATGITTTTTTTLTSTAIAAITATPTTVGSGDDLLPWGTMLPKNLGISDDVFASLHDDYASELSSHGDDDAVLDLARPQIAALTENNGSAPPESSRVIPPSARHALESFARSWMPQTDESHGEGVKDNDVTGTAALTVNTELQQPQQHLILGDMTTHAYLPHHISGGTPIGRGTAMQMPCAPVMFTSVEDCEGMNAVAYQTMGLNSPQHITQYHQTQPQQQVPMMLLPTGDGRMAFYPVVTSFHTPPHVMLPASHLKPNTVQEQQQQTIVYPQVAIPSQQVYSGNWSNLHQTLNPNK
ncbi:hypothetical protein LSM04_000821 [Trypanosoma melophagium]|uniref:uncharacterized protein n=1 Tax=Trypanosoma melophagium TaxID=715481 RepID=UPI00351A0669|nr:hypothetical protein LSM04_000821 [Trypanosoma melophagium]